MALPVDVNTYKSTDSGAPVLNGVAGSLAAVLRACLQNGYNVQSPTSVVVSAGVATATYASAHGYSANRVILVAGASVGAINGKNRVLSITTNALTFDATGVADGPVAGTITTKMAPLGFTEIFTGTNLAAFKSDDPSGQSRSVLRIGDTATTYARVISYESMAGINTGTGPMPTATQLSGGAYIVKSTTADATARPWMVIGDGRIFYLWTYPSNGSGRKNLFCWGEAVSFRSIDAFVTVMVGYNTTVDGSTYPDTGLSAAGAPGAYLGNVTSIVGIGESQSPVLLTQRGVDQMSKSIPTTGFSLAALAGGFGVNNRFSSGSGSIGDTPKYPSDVSGGFMLFQVYFHKSRVTTQSEARGIIPGVYQAAHSLESFVGEEVNGVASAPGKTFLIVPVTDGYNGFDAHVAIDMIGPWR